MCIGGMGAAGVYGVCTEYATDPRERRRNLR